MALLQTLRLRFGIPKEFYVDPNIVWKRCSYNTIVKLVRINAETKRLYRLPHDVPNTMTNECRAVSNPIWAKYRGFPFYCHSLLAEYEHWIGLQEHSFPHDYWPGNRIVYEQNTIVYPNGFDLNLEKVCGKGIHFFKTMEGAVLYDTDICGIKFINEQGDCIVIDENGSRLPGEQKRYISTEPWISLK